MPILAIIVFRRMGLCIKLGEKDENTLGCLLYADDIVKLPENNYTLQRLLEVVGVYGRDFNVSFGVDKHQVMVIEGHNREKRNRWTVEESTGI